MGKEYRISEEYLSKMLDEKSKATVGRILKRVETIADMKTLKEELKNVVYEEFRDIKTTLDAFNSGILFSLKQKNPTE